VNIPIDDRRQCRYIGHDWPTEMRFTPVQEPFEIATTFEVSSAKFQPIKAYATVRCLRKDCPAWRTYDYQGNIVEEGR